MNGWLWFGVAWFLFDAGFLLGMIVRAEVKLWRARRRRFEHTDPFWQTVVASYTPRELAWLGATMDMAVDAAERAGTPTDTAG